MLIYSQYSEIAILIQDYSKVLFFPVLDRKNPINWISNLKNAGKRQMYFDIYSMFLHAFIQRRNSAHFK